MRRPLCGWLAALAVLTSAGSAAAEPPDYLSLRWNGNTSSAQPQGFAQGAPLNLTWGFMNDGSAINNDGSFPNGNSNLQQRLNTLYPGGMSVWQPIFASTFNRWSSISGLSYTYLNADDTSPLNGNPGVGTTRADVRIGGKPLDGNSGVLAYNYFPTVGDMVIDTNDNFFNSTANNSIGLRNVVTHEHGHGIGMDHLQSSNGTFLMEPFVDTSFDGPQYHDILAAQHLYGDAREKTNSGLGNDTLARASSLTVSGPLTAGNSVSVGNSARTQAVAFAAQDFVSVDSSTDTDFYSFNVTAAGRVTALLEALGFTYNASEQGAGSTYQFNTRQRSNLRIRLFDQAGNALTGLIDVNGLGGNEQIVFDITTAGTYYLQITGADNPDAVNLDTQFYALTISYAAPVPEPASVLLAATLAVGGWGVRRLRRGRSVV